ncbi:MAG: hypothetical protein BWY84_00904 [Candidatus Aerophobetes bacterium ADurb.Bin490]|nr:MAG: hypothetical protein BWY84_00904 [Candidatus Aerophobetes bacterium ADurb.Bin490]HNZ29547.1 hypothetical protein [Candidatus Goldiibacteriota bacterium]HPI02492.1 hypothetical protein [Candidatus Goldiibacteriota bacterium]HPN64832.1 hypothetical protein [Candidatus Goldiibacteriota bacterium]HRQ44585.1 hypothetical protein [Candidatus Goldiibacteriota bacterium]
MGIIKNVLREELENSRGMIAQYNAALKKLPKGALIEKIRGKKKYYYIQFREGKSIKWVYKGRMPLKRVQEYKKAMELRKKYRNLLSGLKKQEKYLTGALRGKQDL